MSGLLGFEDKSARAFIEEQPVHVKGTEPHVAAEDQTPSELLGFLGKGSSVHAEEDGHVRVVAEDAEGPGTLGFRARGSKMLGTGFPKVRTRGSWAQLHAGLQPREPRVQPLPPRVHPRESRVRLRGAEVKPRGREEPRGGITSVSAEAENMESWKAGTVGGQWRAGVGNLIGSIPATARVSDTVLDDNYDEDDARGNGVKGQEGG